MPKIPCIIEKPEDKDEGYEIVSFEDFCGKSGGSKGDLLTMNDNINYRLCYDSNKGSSMNYEEKNDSTLTETSLSTVTNVMDNKQKTSGTFAPFGRYNGKAPKGPLYGGVIPKPKADGDSYITREQPRYQRFSAKRNIFQRVWDCIPGMGSGLLAVALVCALCVGVWWAVCGALGGAWGEEHYRKLWERTHPDKPLAPTLFEKSIIKIPPATTQSEMQLQTPENRYHDHNNLSTKNKNASVGAETKKEPLKKEPLNKKLKKEQLNKKYEMEETTPECAQIEVGHRFDCMPNGNQSGCIQRGCCWNPEHYLGVPACYYPPDYDSFKFINMTEDERGINILYIRGRPSGYPGDFTFAKVEIKYLSEDALQVKISDPKNRRFEVPNPAIVPVAFGPFTDKKYTVQVESGTIGFKVIRNSDNVTIIDTTVGGLVLSDRFIQISSLLPTKRIFGLGEHRDSLKKNIQWQIYTLFNRDIPPTPNLNLYGSHPFYLAVEENGKSHGMLLLNSNAMDIVLQPAPAITYRAIGGIINLLIFTGPTPQEVISQYTATIGRPFMPPYWSLGFHLCKFGYHDLSKTYRTWKANRDAGIPFDVQWNDIDYMKDNNDFTIDPVRYKELPSFVKELHRAGMHYMMIFDPGVSGSEPVGTYPPYDRGINMNVFIKNSNGKPFAGRVWNHDSTVFPDFTHPNASLYWYQSMSEFHQQVEFDGAWIDMNEPSNLIKGQIYGPCAKLYYPYTPYWIFSNGLNQKTICMEAEHYIGRHYDVHNLYALYEAQTTYNALAMIRRSRPFIISRASSPGLGRYAGHWSGDINSDWEDMRLSIPNLLSFSLFGVAMAGADICGFRGDTSRELCARWMQLGAFYPFARNHADVNSKPQDPASLGPEVVAASKTALRLRYRLLPYYYTLFWRAHMYGETVARPLFFLSPESSHLDDVENQFLIGPHVMITPILREHYNSTKAYFPGPYKWYNIVDGKYLASERVLEVTEGQTVSIKGGAILALQEPPLTGPVTTTNTRSQPLQLLVAPGDGARGELYWDDGHSMLGYNGETKYSHIEFTLKDQVLNSTVIRWDYGVPCVDNITILGQTRLVKMVTINDNVMKFEYDMKANILCIPNLNLNLNKPFTVKWTSNDMSLKKAESDVNYSRKMKKVSGIVDSMVAGCKGKECSEYD